MKTVIEIIFEKHDKEFDKMNFLRWLSDNRKSLLEVEKEQIIDAFEAGTKEDLFNTWSIPEEVYKKEKSAEYFQQTFKSDE